ncbi:hypothetical protein [Cerasicoccus frondis]|uniref:hypothetical protein n=1 Tax=Cerasicoccus frondis TaxID=490090 RepID=UPI0028525E91|nr:hypothetical protein [Cerasicoccus frondis]
MERVKMNAAQGGLNEAHCECVSEKPTLRPFILTVQARMAFSHQLRYLSAERLPAYSTSGASLMGKIHAAIKSFNLKTLPNARVAESK